MRIDFVEIANFRKLLSTRVGFAATKTIFVGANNSGKTSAMVALRSFLVARDRHSFTLTDFTLSHWAAIDAMGKSWETAIEPKQPLPAPCWDGVLPFIDLWLDLQDEEVHYVQKILPTLDWEVGLLGLRLRLQPKDAIALQQEYLAAREDARVISLSEAGREEVAKSALSQESAGPIITLWPQTLTDFLKRRLNRLFEIKSYVLDPAKLQEPANGRAQPQTLAADIDPVDGDPLRGLIRIHEISAQRGFSEGDGLSEDGDAGEIPGTAKTRKLTDQLRHYYKRHLDPYDKPDAQDVEALRAIEIAQKAFDKRLIEGFDAALKEMEALGYPGIANPKLNISTRLHPMEGLNHEAAVQYQIPFITGGQAINMHLPEGSNGLGYQNLISMVFRLMSFRDAWMRVGKAQKRTVEGGEAFIPPLHLVLVEEPEAYLHAQVQQAFIRRAYDVLRNHSELKRNTRFTTQLVVSTHSSHIAHECDFASLRYFRRLPAIDGEVPTSCVVNLTTVFGEETDTKRFVTRYLKVIHCDLFFADAAVLIEGPAERILVPHFVRNHPEFSDLSECYVTWLEIGGSHAHRLKDLIEKLGLTTLVITDLDAIGEDRKKVVPTRGKNQKSRNATLKSWVPGSEDLDELLDKTSEAKIKRYERFSVRAAYQSPIRVRFKGKEEEALANTLEDALVFENIDLFAVLEGAGLLARFKLAIAESNSLAELGEKLSKDLSSGDKAELAMDLLELKDAKALKPPTYIRDGLLWLSSQLANAQREFGLPAIAAEGVATPQAEAAE